MMPHADGTSKGAEFVAGPLWSCIESGGIFLADELNLASPAVVAVLAHLLDFPPDFTNPISGTPVKVHEDFAFLATQNPPKYAGRNMLPPALRRRVITLEVAPYKSAFHEEGGESKPIDDVDNNELAEVLRKDNTEAVSSAGCGVDKFVAAALGALKYDPSGADDSTGLRHFLKL